MTNWKAYPYVAILTPGYGPEETQIEFSPIGRLACAEAVKRWKARKAPFIIVSGGHVHPNRTPYSEAIEMKRCLMHEFQIPEGAIWIDPHARHTTTNVRNAVRIIARNGFPVDRPFLVVTNPYQAMDISSPAFARRCQGVFGYVPYSDPRLLSAFEVAPKPDLRSLSIDPLDPLDP